MIPIQVTIFREIPFSMIQFPLWEFLKVQYKESMGIDRPLGFFEGGFFGAISGAIAAASTTPIGRVKAISITIPESKTHLKY